MERITTTESPETYIWSEYLFLENEITGRSFLKEKYNQLNVSHPERVAFRNVQAFNDYIKQARAIFSTLDQNSLWVQPLLLYYGMMALVKAFVLTKDINYPESTTVLRHGLSTRRRKKAQFRFFEDDIRVQKEGLFPHVAYLLNTSLYSGDSYKAEGLLSCIPEMQESFQRLFKVPTLLPITIDSHTEKGTNFSIPSDVLDTFHITASSFIRKLNAHSDIPLFQVLQGKKTDKVLSITWKHPDVHNITKWEKGFSHPWFFHDTKGNFYLWTGKNRYGSPLPEVLSQHMLVFALSMICRYETTLWGDIAYTSTSLDTILIKQLLSIVKRKFPHLMLNLMREENIILLIK